MRFADLDAVTCDAFGTLVTLREPTAALAELLAEHGAPRPAAAVAAAFAAEADYYTPRSWQGRDAESLARLRRESAGVFLDAVGADLARDEFAPAFVSALTFERVEGSLETLEALRARGLSLAVVSNWDVSLPDTLASVGLEHLFTVVISSAAAGVAKPDPRIFELALEELGVAPERVLHVGDDAADEQGAAAARIRFARAPLRSAFEEWL